MNPLPNNPSDPQAIRTEIEQTRQRMDRTIDALGDRLSPRHLADEALGFLRTKTQNVNMRDLTHRIGHSADTAMHSVVHSVKANPIPVALIGAGIAYYFFQRSRSQADDGWDYSDQMAESAWRNEGGAGADYPAEADDDLYASDGLERGARTAGAAGGGLGDSAVPALSGIGEKVHAAKQRIQEGAGQLAARARDGTRHVGDRSRQLLDQGRRRVVQSVEAHPLESGLVCLALGLIAGVAMPTSAVARRRLAPRARQVRDQAQQLMERGRTVARTALDAAKREAETQGLVKSGASADQNSSARPQVGDSGYPSAAESTSFARPEGRLAGSSQAVTP